MAHESEVPAPGDYVTRSMGEHPVIVARGEDGHIRVLLNVCRHRGMRICRADLGNASHFRCPYHGFTYKNTGELIGIPFQKEIYGEGVDKAKFGLIEARTESYGGLVFATWDDRAPQRPATLGRGEAAPLPLARPPRGRARPVAGVRPPSSSPFRLTGSSSAPYRGEWPSTR